MLQNIPRETPKSSTPKITPSQKIVEITYADPKTSADTQENTTAKTLADAKTSAAVKTSTATQTVPDKIIESKRVETQTEIPNVDKRDKNTQTKIGKE